MCNRTVSGRAPCRQGRHSVAALSAVLRAALQRVSRVHCVCCYVCVLAVLMRVVATLQVFTEKQRHMRRRGERIRFDVVLTVPLPCCICVLLFVSPLVQATQPRRLMRGVRLHPRDHMTWHAAPWGHMHLGKWRVLFQSDKGVM